MQHVGCKCGALFKFGSRMRLTLTKDSGTRQATHCRPALCVRLCPCPQNLATSCCTTAGSVSAFNRAQYPSSSLAKRPCQSMLVVWGCYKQP